LLFFGVCLWRFFFFLFFVVGVCCGVCFVSLVVGVVFLGLLFFVFFLFVFFDSVFSIPPGQFQVTSFSVPPFPLFPPLVGFHQSGCCTCLPPHPGSNGGNLAACFVYKVSLRFSHALSFFFSPLDGFCQTFLFCRSETQFVPAPLNSF